MPPWSESSDLKLCHNIICCTHPAGKSQHPQHIKQKTEAVTLQLEPRTAPNIPAAVAFHFLPGVGPVPAVLYDHDVITHIDHSVMQEHLPVHLLSWEENLPPPVLWWYRYNLLHKTPVSCRQFPAPILPEHHHLNPQPGGSCLAHGDHQLTLYIHYPSCEALSYSLTISQL